LRIIAYAKKYLINLYKNTMATLPIWNTSPLDQFTIRNLFSLKGDILGNIQISLTNMGLYLTITTYIIVLFYLLANNYDRILPNHWSLSLESKYASVFSIVVNQINMNKGQMFFPLISSLFIYILINNLVGMVPYSFAPTSHFILTFSISFTIVIGATILGFQIHALKFFSFFVPSGCPLGLLPLLVLIEFISYLSRNVSLGLRLGANILSGHMLLNILSGFTYNIMSNGFIYFFLGLIPLLFILAFSGLEIGIAFIQAQVFVVLSASYIKDSLDLH
jgi:F-type H+-transporting ATPase subunit a